jgi:hypothetical protein
MFHVKRVFLLGWFFLFCAFEGTFAQGRYAVSDTPFIHSSISDSVDLGELRRNPAFIGLSPKEQEFFRWVNVFRRNPGEFRVKFVLPFLAQFPNLQGPEAKSLLEDLKEAQPLDGFTPDLVLNKTSRAHAMDLSQRPHVLDHNSKNGASFKYRMELAGKKRCAGENLYDGENDPLFALMVLLIDYGLPSAGHRKALMKPDFSRMGVSIQPWKGESRSVVLVEDFSCD